LEKHPKPTGPLMVSSMPLMAKADHKKLLYQKAKSI